MTPTREDILEIAEEVREDIGNPMGECLEASKKVARALRRKDIPARVVRGTFRTDFPFDLDDEEHEFGGPAAHWWVEAAGWLVDVTADQFDDEIEGEPMPPVLVARPGEWAHRYVRGPRPDAKGRKR